MATNLVALAMKTVFLLLSIGLLQALPAQTVYTPAFISFHAALGQSGAKPIEASSKALAWKTNRYPIIDLAFQYHRQWHPRWSLSGGLGFTAFLHQLKQGASNYNAGFGTPKAELALQYFFHTQRPQYFFKLTSGIQLGYRDILEEVYPNFRATAQGFSAFYYFLSPELGLRWRSKIKTKEYGVNGKLSFELSFFYRHNINKLGEIRLYKDGALTVFQPRGSFAGIRFGILYPISRDKKAKSKTIDYRGPVILCPRF